MNEKFENSRLHKFKLTDSIVTNEFGLRVRGDDGPLTKLEARLVKMGQLLLISKARLKKPRLCYPDITPSFRLSGIKEFLHPNHSYEKSSNFINIKIKPLFNEKELIRFAFPLGYVAVREDEAYDIEHFLRLLEG